MSIVAQVIGWIIFGFGVLGLANGLSRGDGLGGFVALSSAGPVLGGVLLIVIGEIAWNVASMRKERRNHQA